MIADLSDNTNLWGSAPSALEALRSAGLRSGAARYPSRYRGPLDRAIAEWLGVKPEQVMTGCGSDDVLDAAFRGLASPGDRVTGLDPSFAMVPEFCRINRLVYAPVPLEPDSQGGCATPPESFAGRSDAAITYLCSPNNPTGTYLSPEVIRLVVERVAGVVIVDGAYAEFAKGQPLELLELGERVVLTGTFSKAWGLAGLRIGYAVGHPGVIDRMRHSRGPFKVSRPAEQAACAALQHDREWLGDSVARARAAVSRLTAGLSRLERYRVLPSAGNFVCLVRRDGGDIGPDVDLLNGRGMLVRKFSRLGTLGSAMRITAGPEQLMDRVVELLSELKSEAPCG